ncbi:MAG: homocitrate synthase family protein [Methanothrix sp.]|jgi:methanogen homocitrate synthase|uniref:2-isopropylmalate synthase n=1 Tax=Methanothrix harundinacea TaxID=301375 RepID=A0A101IK15_9EURY|nr:MAG: homoaconitate hydratase [Methanosaeta sp. SDB]KUK45022.1 MAG: 2-isopropylmalate synthase [Methanothrix harundinacea]MDD2637585.1 homocitrate synthase family protein [Methanothrix sp.]MDI9400081.1 homocitrate synthase family protein [Euryarchaeota archaeon]KUK96710.1 MAG: 2-isopropylmalate synthase [Methanothrix harundinacea]
MSDYSVNQFLELSKTPKIDIEVCDVTLRDGEQMPGVVFRPDEKLDIAIKLNEVGVEIIEAGFPVVSEAEKRAVQDVSNLGLDSKISVLSRSVPKDVDAALDCDVDMVSVFIATSELHLKYKLHMTCDQAVKCAFETVEYAKDHGLIVRFSAEDATRTDFELLKRLYRRAEECGADYVSIADTVGIMNPRTTYYLVREIKKEVNVPICMHCHDDLGMALANTLAAAEAGAKQLHTTVNGIGERSGNTPLEELMVALKVHYGVDRYDTTKLTSLSKLVQSYSGVIMPKNKAVVGENAFAHESGIHVAAVLEEPRTYELYSPEMVGSARRIIIGKHTGARALKYITKKMGYDLKRDEICLLAEKVKRCSEFKRPISCDELRKLIHDLDIEIVYPDL